jgi:hypothetical protein
MQRQLSRCGRPGRESWDVVCLKPRISASSPDPHLCSEQRKPSNVWKIVQIRTAAMQLQIPMTRLCVMTPQQMDLTGPSIGKALQRRCAAQHIFTEAAQHTVLVLGRQTRRPPQPSIDIGRQTCRQPSIDIGRQTCRPPRQQRSTGMIL